MSQQKIYGFHAVMAHMTSGYVRRLCLQQSRDDQRMQQLRVLAEQHGVACETVSKRVLDDLMPQVVHQGVVAMTDAMVTLNEKDLMRMLEHLPDEPFLLVLDQVQDPHNLGACLRSALAAGVHAVIVPKDNAASLTSTVVKVACGAVGQVPLVRVTNLSRTLIALKKHGIWLYGAAEQGEHSVYKQKLIGAMAWVMGAEGQGLRRLTREHCDVLCHIPTASALSSLNVSVATGVCLFESLRQRLANQP